MRTSSQIHDPLCRMLLVYMHSSGLELPYIYRYPGNRLQESQLYDPCALQLIVLILGGCRPMGVCVGGWAGMGQEAPWKEGPVWTAADLVRQSVQP